MNTTTPHESFWYAVSTRSRQEKVAASMLCNLGIRHFLPLIAELRRWSDRQQKVSLPLFPGYLFVNIASSGDARLQVLKIPGVVKFVGGAHGPAPIPEEEIHSIRVVLSQGIECSPCPFLKAGDRVRIVQGALAGVEGTFMRSGRDSELVISIEMIQRAVAINLRGCQIRPISGGASSYVSSAEPFFSKARIA